VLRIVDLTLSRNSTDPIPERYLIGCSRETRYEQGALSWLE